MNKANQPDSSRVSFASGKIKQYYVDDSTGITATNEKGAKPTTDIKVSEEGYNASEALYSNIDALGGRYNISVEEKEDQNTSNDENLQEDDEDIYVQKIWQNIDDDDATEEEIIKNLGQYLGTTVGNNTRRISLENPRPPVTTTNILKPNVKFDNFCRQCGENYQEKDKFCGNCGNSRNQR